MTFIKDRGVNVYLPEGAHRAEPVEPLEENSGFNHSKVRLAIASGVLGVGAISYLISGVANESEGGAPEPFDGGNSLGTHRILTEKMEREDRVVPIEAPFENVFHDLEFSSRVEARNTVDEMNEVIKKNQSFRDMVWVTQKNEQKIREAAQKYGIPEEIALGIVLIENGGGDDLFSEALARGPCQFLPKTAREYGLEVDKIFDESVPENPDKYVDERITDKCFEAMCKYIATMRESFGGDLGITVWAYHAGQGNVYSALREYFIDTMDRDFGDATDFESPDNQKIVKNYSDQIKKSNLNVHQLLSNERVRQNVLAFLGDETDLYASKAVAAAEIYAQIYKEEKAKEILSSSE